MCSFWQLVLELTRMSRGMRELLVQEKVVAKMIDFYMGNESPLQGTVFKDGQRKRAVMGNKYGRPKWSTMIQAVSELVCGCHTAATQSNGSVDSPGADEPAGALPPTTIVSHDASGNPPPLLTLDELSSKCVLNRHFFQAALQHQDNGRAIGRIMAHQSWGWGKFSEHAVNILVTGVEAADYDDCHAYFQAMDELLSVKDSLRVWRMQELFQDGDHVRDRPSMPRPRRAFRRHTHAQRIGCTAFTDWLMISDYLCPPPRLAEHHGRSQDVLPEVHSLRLHLRGLHAWRVATPAGRGHGTAHY